MSNMDSLGERIKQLRKQANMSQTDLANQVGISYAQVGRYETKGVQPPAEVLKKIADALNSTVDFLINGSANQKAQAVLVDSELLRQFQYVEQMNDADKKVIMTLIDAFITKRQLQQLAS